MSTYTLPSLKLENPIAQQSLSLGNTSSLSLSFPSLTYPQGSTLANQWAQKYAPTKSNTGNALGASAVNAISSIAGSALSNQLFDDSEMGAIAGNIFSSGVSSAASTMANNIMKGTSLTKGLSSNLSSSLAGAGVGIAANYLGQGLNSALGDSRLSRGLTSGLSTAAGTIGGAAVANALSTGAKAASSINPIGLAMNVGGAVLGGVLGPSKEYTGKYGNITQTMDTAYDIGTAATAFVPGIGWTISGGMALNRGLGNLFGSTDGMTKTDAILGSAFMPAPIKWLNVLGSSKTGTFDNQSWQNTEKTNAFMGNAFGNLQERFDKAREEAGKTYGTFSQGAKKSAQDNIDYANRAWEKILNMTNQNEYQNIRSSDMTSINNQRYAQGIQGGISLTARGKQGMKILNNATNHSVGMRLLSGAALIDNKQMILSRCRGLD